MIPLKRDTPTDPKLKRTSSFQEDPKTSERTPRTPRGPQVDPKRTPRGPQEDPKRTPKGPAEDPERTPKRLRENPKRTPGGPQEDPIREPKDLKRSARFGKVCTVRRVCAFAQSLRDCAKFAHVCKVCAIAQSLRVCATFLQTRQTLRTRANFAQSLRGRAKCACLMGLSMVAA